MKGFIEVTDNSGYIYLINIRNIDYVGVNNHIYLNKQDVPIKAVETYQEIKQLIKEATENQITTT